MRIVAIVPQQVAAPSIGGVGYVCGRERKGRNEGETKIMTKMRRQNGRSVKSDYNQSHITEHVFSAFGNVFRVR